MFAEDPKQLELLITRHLDGRLSEEEELEFQRLLLRVPQARRTLEAYERLDAAAGEALRGALPDAEPAFDPVELARPRRSTAAHRHYHRAWWLLPAAVAASLLLAVTTQTFWHAENPAGVPAGSLVNSLDAPPETVAGMPARLGPGHLDSRPNVIPASAMPRRTLRHTDRQLIGIEGEDGQIYWLELDQTRTLRGQSARGNTRLASGGV